MKRSPGLGRGVAGRLDDGPLLAAAWLEESLAHSLGPRGGTTLVQAGDGSSRIAKGSAALREAAIAHADVQPYLRLAEAVSQEAGDHATTGVLLAARLVRFALEDAQRGLPVVASLDGHALALRQALARLTSLRRLDGGASLDALLAEGSGWRKLVLEGLRALPRDGVLDLEAIDVRAGPVELPKWLDGLVAAPQHVPPQAPKSRGVLLVAEEWKPRPQQDVAVRVRDPETLAAMSGVEEGMRLRVLESIQSLNVGLVACARGIDAELAQRLAGQGTLVWTDAPLSALRRLEKATGARMVPRVTMAHAKDVGAASFTHRPMRQGGDWLVQGAGPGSTLLVPGLTPTARGQAIEAGERWLRAAGLWLRAPGAVPGAGQWQREVAKSLRAAADAASGKTPLAIRNAARAFDALADDLVRNAGGDALAGGIPAGAQDVLDPAEGVRRMVGAAFETARQVLRVDGRFVKRPSTQTWLRGGTGRVGSPKGLPGDIPPLM